MEVLIPLFAIAFFLLALAVFTNLYREHRRFDFTLKPNCLLTRKPVVFLTGPRSLFYFRKYWNGYPEVLAEHGYEVFTLPLPWRGEERLRRMQEYLEVQTKLGRKYHFICDRYTAEELKKLFDGSQPVASLTVIEGAHNVVSSHTRGSFFLSLSYRLHSLSYRHERLPRAEDLGLDSPTAKEWLLEKMQVQGEQDFLT